MKPFDIEKARNGHPVCTRDGRDVEILKSDLKNKYPIAAVIKDERDIEEVLTWLKNGKYYMHDQDDNDKDLFLKSEQKEGWVNVFDSPIGAVTRPIIYKTKEEALSEPATDQEDYIDTVPIKWEE